MKLLGYVLTALPLLLGALVIEPRVLLLHWGVAAAMLVALHHANTRLPVRRRPPAALYPGLALGLAVRVTMHQAAGYFATGAVGAAMPALLASYRMWGFHPNWRTVLFSTIMMVVLITWPRKFKRLHKIIPAGFVGVVLTTLLNVFLYPDAARVIIPELFWRIPASPLAMLLIFTAWQHVPYARLRGLLWYQKLLLCVLVGAMFWFNPLWVVLGCAVAWLLRVARRRGILAKLQ
ncbi:MAG: hypothetical protein FWB76_01030 [Oscillospiraceae bacterium]|nr:hypothetical protein [Oscillospiraceae bacterium]